MTARNGNRFRLIRPPPDTNRACDFPRGGGVAGGGTIVQAVERDLADAARRSAPNVNPMEASRTHATVARWLKLLAEDDLACEKARCPLDYLSRSTPWMIL